MIDEDCALHCWSRNCSLERLHSWRRIAPCWSAKSTASEESDVKETLAQSCFGYMPADGKEGINVGRERKLKEAHEGGEGAEERTMRQN